jgi:hypothetical protein
MYRTFDVIDDSKISMKKAFPFNSKYLPNFQVVEQRDGNISRFPHTDQLPRLLAALNKEFRDGLPDRIARVDQRAKGYMKIQRYTAALLFSGHVNRARRDELSLYVLTDKNLVPNICIVQHIVEHVDPAPIHRFKFYGGDHFYTEFYLNGKRIAFANHALERFSERLPNAIGTDLTKLLSVFCGSPAVLMGCNDSPAFVYCYDDSVMAFPVRESDGDPEYFFPTCLSVNEINNLEAFLPPPAYTLHYDPAYKAPEVRNWDPIKLAMAYHARWARKVPLAPKVTQADTMSWSEMGHRVSNGVKKMGHGEGSRFLFRDNIPGPNTILLLPGEPEPRHIELEDMKRHFPGRDWERIIPQLKAANPRWYGDPQISGQSK